MESGPSRSLEGPLTQGVQNAEAPQLAFVVPREIDQSVYSLLGSGDLSVHTHVQSSDPSLPKQPDTSIHKPKPSVCPSARLLGLEVARLKRGSPSKHLETCVQRRGKFNDIRGRNVT